MLYEFKMGQDTIEVAKNICCEKGEGTVDHNIVTRWFRLGCKNLSDQARSGRSKAIEANPTSSIQGVSDELGILQSNVVHHLHDIGKSIQSCWIVPHITNFFKSVWEIQFFGQLLYRNSVF